MLKKKKGKPKNHTHKKKTYTHNPTTTAVEHFKA